MGFDIIELMLAVWLMLFIGSVDNSIFALMVHSALVSAKDNKFVMSRFMKLATALKTLRNGFGIYGREAIATGSGTLTHHLPS